MTIQEVFEDLVEIEDRRRAATLRAALLCSGYMLKFLEIVDPGCTAKLAEHENVSHQEYSQQIGRFVVSMRVVKSDTDRQPPRASEQERNEMLSVGRWMVESAKLAYITMCGIIPDLKNLGLVVSKETGDILFEKNPQYSLRMVADPVII